MTESTSFFSRSGAALLALSVAAIGSLLMGGCAREDYYCDNTGCYYCDGVGCRSVNPPTRTPCHGDYQCPNAGDICTSAGCAHLCTSNADCPQGTVCPPADDAGTAQRICRTPTEVQPTPVPGVCTTNADCASGAVCLNGLCHNTTTPVCNSNADCTGGNVCIEHVCTAPSNTCQFNNQCGAGRLCVNSECRLACNATTPCPTGQTCSAEGYCVDATPTGCTSAAQCASGQTCLNGTCLQSCTPGAVPMTCATGLYCSDNGVCIPDTRPHPFCSSDSQCASGSSCVNGVCRLPCTTSIECQMHDVTYRNCGHIPNQPTITQTYCLTDNETTPQCSSQAGCAAGQSCIDGQCR